LRRLEEVSAADAVKLAVELLDEKSPLLRLNAIALLTRSKAPEARLALGTLNERSRRLAGALAMATGR
jgi:hypothetical protein